ncbi:hypothetical protein J1N35_015746 [Gossypium stocksii]|uniref:Uncharacterized protein n=1 Tax=Gossypium stocksii TaxID=47602 RepID=A0A9D4AA59_9ROSI|nr:hypothetical protein J1N35_015746 [Gossypium stocksii]
MHLRLDADVQKLEAEKLRKEKMKVEEDRDDLKIQYKKIQLGNKKFGRKEPEPTNGRRGSKKFKHGTSLERSLAKSQKEKSGLKARVAELGRSLHQHRSCNSAIELKASLNQIEEMKDKIGRLESALQNCELRIEQLKVREGHWKEELHHFQEQVRNRDYLMGEAIAQIREVADHLQTLAV